MRARIIALKKAEPALKAREIATRLDCRPHYVYQTLWKIKNPEKARCADKVWRKKNSNKRSSQYRKQDKKWRNAVRKKNYALGRTSTSNAHQCWTHRDDLLVLGEFSGTDRELGISISRSVQAIQVRRVTLRKAEKKVLQHTNNLQS